VKFSYLLSWRFHSIDLSKCVRRRGECFFRFRVEHFKMKRNRWNNPTLVPVPTKFGIVSEISLHRQSHFCNLQVVLWDREMQINYQQKCVKNYSWKIKKTNRIFWIFISQFPINFSKILLHSVDFQRIQMAQVARLLCCEVDSTWSRNCKTSTPICWSLRTKNNN